MAKITYDDKSTLNPQPSIANENKVTSGDMNEIKTVVNGLDDEIGTLSNLNTTVKTDVVSALNECNGKVKNNTEYSTTETIVGTWTNGKPIYRKCFIGSNLSIGTQNTTISSNFASNLDDIISITSTIKLGGSPYSGITRDWNTLLSTGGSLIMVAFNTARTFDKVNIIVEYTKTTD